MIGQGVHPNFCSYCTAENQACPYHASYGLHPEPPQRGPQPPAAPAGCSEGYAWQADRFTTK